MNSWKIGVLWLVFTGATTGLAWRTYDNSQIELKAMKDDIVIQKTVSARTQAQYEEILRRLDRIETALDNARR